MAVISVYQFDGSMFSVSMLFSRCLVFHPIWLVSNYDYLWCLLTYLFYCQKGIVLFLMYVALSFPVLSIICAHSYVIKCKCLHYPRCVLPMRIVIVY